MRKVESHLTAADAEPGLISTKDLMDILVKSVETASCLDLDAKLTLMVRCFFGQSGACSESVHSAPTLRFSCSSPVGGFLGWHSLSL